MKTLLVIKKENFQTIRTIFWTVLAIVVIMSTPYIINAEDFIINARLWYIASVISYAIIGYVVIEKTNPENILFLEEFIIVRLIINISAIVILLVGFVLHYFYFFPSIITDIIGGWTGAVSFILFIILSIWEYLSREKFYYSGE